MRSPALTVNRRSPRAAGFCQRCNVHTNLYKLSEQFAWRGNSLAPTGLFVCSKCIDQPNPQMRARRIDADPVPVKNPSPPRFVDPLLLGAESPQEGFLMTEDNQVIQG